MRATVDIFGYDMEVEYDFKMTSPGSREIRPDMDQPGSPAEPAEFDITVEGITFSTGSRKGEALDLPEWLKDMLATHLADDDQVYLAMRAQSDDDAQGDPDEAYERMRDDRDERDDRDG